MAPISGSKRQRKIARLNLCFFQMEGAPIHLGIEDFKILTLSRIANFALRS